MKLQSRIQVTARTRLGDSRGAFLKVMKGDEENLPASFGEAYLVWAGPGQSRGGHFHPLTAEWFTLIDGRCRLVAVDPTDGERIVIDLDASDPKTVFVPAGVAHRFDSVAGRPWALFAYAANRYDPTDTVAFDCGKPET